jgi:hypothetical protein
MMQISETTGVIACKRGSAKHNVKDDHAFLWKHAIFSACPAEISQPINMKFCTKIMSVRLRDVPNMVAIGCLEAAPQIGEL